MAVLTTPKWATPYPDGNELISLGDDSLKNLALAIDDHTKLQVGTFAARPTAATAKAGKYYLASDTSFLYLSDGTNWIEIAPGAGSVPIGGLFDYAGSADPADTRYMLCDGREISRTTFAALYTVLGGGASPYGLGNGTTTFNIPDVRGRTAAAPDNMGTAKGAASRLTANNTRGAGSGAEKHTMITSEMPSHKHTPVTVGGLDASSSFQVYNEVGSGGPRDMPVSGNGRSSYGFADMPNTGGNSPHNNMPPYLVINKVIRVQ